MRPALVAGLLVVLIVSQLLYGLGPYRRRAYLPVLLLTTAGFGLGQLWSYAGLPALHLGDLDILPALLFAVALQPLADRLRIRSR